MASPYPINAHRRQRARGFTLLEVMMVTFISSFVFAGVLSAYIFLGRALSRQVNAQSLESPARLALFYLTQDVSMASSVIAVNPPIDTSAPQSVLTLTVPGAPTSIVYSWDWTLGPGLGRLTRQVGANPPLTLLTHLSSFNFGYADATGSPLTVPTSTPAAPQITIKQIYMTFTSSAGYGPSGNVSQFTVESPSIVLKNKPLLKDPNDI
jgi:prepilin-type N-terminal cleavage/methylation domain-containing protein